MAEGVILLKGDEIRQYRELLVVTQQMVEEVIRKKGKIRHATGAPMEQQPACILARAFGPGYPLGKAMSDIQESTRIGKTDRKIGKLLSAMFYVAVGIIELERLAKERKEKR